MNEGIQTAAAASASPWVAAISNLSSVGVICYMLIVEVPKMQDDFAAELRLVRESYKSEITIERDAHDREIDRLTTSIDNLAQAIRGSK